MLGMKMDSKKLQSLATELAKGIKTEADLNAFSRELLKLTVETALSAELTDHLGYEKHGDSRIGRGNVRNGRALVSLALHVKHCRSKTLISCP